MIFWLKKPKKIKREKKNFIANNLFTWFVDWKNPRKEEERKQKSLPIIYLHDFCIEKTKKKREKKNHSQ